MNTEYEIVKTASEREDYFSWKYFLRQLFVSSLVWMNFFLFGLCIGGPTVYIPQLRREANSTDAVSEEMASWLTSVYGYGSLPWSILLSMAATFLGRKPPHIFVTISTFAAFLFFYLSSSVTEILISQCMESILGSSLITISVLMISEVTTPQYRGVFLTIKSASFSWGVWVANAIGTYYHWKKIALLKLVLSVYPLVVIFFCPESPYWLATKGRLDKCAEVHRWLKGHDQYSERELVQLLESKRNTIKKNRSLRHIFTKDYYKHVLLCLCVIGLYTFTGKITGGFYALDIIQKMTSSESAAYSGMLLLDGVSVLGMYVGSILSKFYKRRTLFLIASSVGVASLCVLGFYTFLISRSVFEENVFVSLALLSVYSMGIACGPIIFCTSIYAELLPLEFRSLAICLASVYDRFLLGTIVKLAPLVMQNLGLHALFFLFGITSAISVFLLYKYMPETKDKTLLEIDEEIKGLKVSEESKLNPT